MSSPWPKPWSDSPTAPSISKFAYTTEKATLAGSFIGAILYGSLTLLFFQCMAALLNPAHRKEEGIKRWLIFYTVAMFSFVTVYTAMNLYIQSNSFIDHRGHFDDELPLSGPLYYQFRIRVTALGFVPNVMFNLNNWLADGLLIYRCYIIYSTNLWVIVLPCLMYLASLGMAITSLYFQYEYNGASAHSALGLSNFYVQYLSISVSLNVLLTLMIVTRLVLHGRTVRTATGSLAGISGLYKTISTILIESCALFAVNSLLIIGALATVVYPPNDNIYAGGFVVDIFFPILTEIQVIAPLLIIQRVANGSALTGHAITTGHASSFEVGGQGEPKGSDGTPLCGCLKNSAAGCGKNPGEPEVVV